MSVYLFWALHCVKHHLLASHLESWSYSELQPSFLLLPPTHFGLTKIERVITAAAVSAQDSQLASARIHYIMCDLHKQNWDLKPKHI
jgi:hypothetical protein